MAFSVAVRCLLLGLGLYLALAADLTVDLRTGNSTGGGDYLTWVREPYKDALSFVDQECSWQGVLKMTFHKKERRTAEIKMTFVNSTFFSFHLGDSITNDGWGGDLDTQKNNAEVHAYGRQFVIMGRSVRQNPFQLLYLHRNLLDSPNVTLTARDLTVEAVNDLGIVRYESKELFTLDGQHDKYGKNFDLYLGMNRAIMNNTRRQGSGLCSVEITWHKK